MGYTNSRTQTREWLEQISTPMSRRKGARRGGLATQHLLGRHDTIAKDRCPLCEREGRVEEGDEFDGMDAQTWPSRLRTALE